MFKGDKAMILDFLKSLLISTGIFIVISAAGAAILKIAKKMIKRK